MASPSRTPKFHVPRAMNEPPVDEDAPEAGHPHAGNGTYLVNRKTGEVYPWTERMAERGDMLYATDTLPQSEREDDPLKDFQMLALPPDQIAQNGPSRAS